MIKVVTCTCGSAEGLVRQALHRYEYKKWAVIPLIQGKAQSLSALEGLMREYPESDELKALYAHINNSSKWAVIIGYKNDSVEWSDISRGDIASDVRAEVIVEKFGE